MNILNITFHQFYHQEAVKLIEESHARELDSTFVGRSKDALDVADSALQVTDVVAMFGPYHEPICVYCSAALLMIF